MEGLTAGFFRRQVAVLALAAPLLWAVFHYTSLDFALTDPFYSPTLRTFPLRHALWLEYTNHQIPKYAFAALWVWALVQSVRTRSARLGWVALMMALSPLVVASFKYTSHHSCPWSLARYGGTADHFGLFFEPVPANPGPGNGFPAGHASACASMMAFFFLYYPERPRRAYAWLGGALAMSQLTGFGQVTRGAHFVSHNMWTAWVVWAVCVTVAFVAWRRSAARA